MNVVIDTSCVVKSLGPSYASVGKIQRGARRIPLDGQSKLTIEFRKCKTDSRLYFRFHDHGVG